MTIQLAVSTRNARLDAIETDAGTSAILKLRTGAQPANCAAADTGTAIVSITMASDWASAAAAGAKSLSSLPLSTTAIASGTPAHFRLYKSDGVTCILQGSVTFTGSGGDMTIDAAGSVTSGQTVNITSFTLTDGNA